VKSSDKTIGARGVRNYIKKEVENKVSELIVDCAEDENKIELDVKDGRIDISLQNVKIEQAKA
jgi:ATP-dependent Clp protease ATP-binding subunit ClpA